MKKLVKPCLLCLLVLISTAMPVSAETVTLLWDPSPSFGIAGYNIYYRTNTPNFPFKGTSLSEGASPVVVNSSVPPSLVIDLPEDGDIYYFTVTAFNSNGLPVDPCISSSVFFLTTELTVIELFWISSRIHYS